MAGYEDFVKNPNAASASNISAVGFRKYLRPYLNGVVDAASQFTYLGATKNYSPTTDEQTREFTANLFGVEETLKRQLASRTKSYTWMTGSTGDKDVAALFYGSAPITGSGAYANVLAVEDTGAATTGDTILVFEPSEGLGAVCYYPSESTRGTGPGDEDGFQTFEFESTIQSLATFTPPAGLVTVGRATPGGVIYLMPKAEIPGFLEDLMDAVSTFTPA